MRVFAILKPEKEEKGVGEEGGGGGGGAIERSRLIKGHIKLSEQKNREINGGLRKWRVCSRRKAGEMNSGSANFRRLRKFRTLRKFPGKKLLPSPRNTCKTEN